MSRPLVFVDTWAYRALADRRDPLHSDAAARMQTILRDGVLPVTSNYVLDEALTGVRTRRAPGELSPSGMTCGAWSRRERSSSNGSTSAVNERPGASSSATRSCGSCRSPIAPPSPSWWSGIDRVLTDDRDFDRVNLGFVRV